MAQIPTTRGNPQATDIAVATALPMVGSLSREDLQATLGLVDAELSKLFEDRNILLADGGIIALNAAGSSVSFTQSLKLHLNSLVAGGSPVVIDLASTSRTFTATGRMLYAVINRGAGTATVTADATTLPAVTSSNQEVVLIAKRIDSSDGTAMVYFRNGFALKAAQSGRFDKNLPYGADTDSTTTGTSATLASFLTNVVRLTNSSLLSISGIPAGQSGQLLIVENKTGNFLTINNDDSGATAANRIFSGTGAPVSMPNNATFAFTYDTTSSRWMLTGGSGSGSGGGGSKNYLSTYIASLASGVPNSGNGNFEFGSVTGFSLGTTGTLTNGIPTGTPTFGSGASGNLSISAVNSGQLAGSYSMSYASSAATTAGNMVASDAFYIDAEDQAKVLTWKFYYKAQTNPGNGNFSGTSSNSFGVAVYDVTNSVWLGTSANFAMTQSSGIGFASGSFQTNTTTAQLRFVIYNANASAGAITMYFDDLSVGPQTIPFGVPASDWTPYTPTISAGFGTATNIVGKWRRVGDSLQGRIGFTSGTVAAALASFTLPSGYALDIAKISTNNNTSSPGDIVGKWGSNDPQANNHGFIIPAPATSTTLLYFTLQQAAAAVHLIPTNGNVSFANNTAISVEFTVPIAGWSSNVQMSQDSDTRVVMAKASGTPANTTANNPIIYPTVNFDTHAAYNASTGRYTVPVTGRYRISAMIDISAVAFLIIYKNGSADTGGNIGYTPSNIGLCTGIVDCVAGDIIDLRPDTNTGGHTARNHSITFERISGPTVIAASETIAASFGQNPASSGTLATTAGSATVWPFRNFDTHNAYNTSNGQYTVPASGIYQVGMTSIFPVSAQIDYYVFVNGVVRAGRISVGIAVSSGAFGTGPTLIKVNAGDIITLVPDASVGLSTTALSGAAGVCPTVSIHRIGI